VLPGAAVPGDDTMAETKPKKPKFKYTRELMKIAIADGMTQKEIGDLCRVEQSVVSGWSRGQSLAFEHQIAELKKRYGNRLNRTTSRVYLAVSGKRSDARWEDTERARRLNEIREKLKKEEAERQAVARQALDELENEVPVSSVSSPARKRGRVLKASQDMAPKPDAKPSPAEMEWRELQEVILPGEQQLLSFETLSQIDQEEFEAARRPVQLVQVEGPIVLRYTFVQFVPLMRKVVELTRLPVARWLVHRQPNGKFVLVRQEHRVLAGRSRWRWRELLRAADEEATRRFSSGVHSANTHFERQADEEPYVECTDDSARWLSSIQGPMDAAALLDFCDTYFQDLSTLHGPHDDLSLPFLLRKMLIEHGHEVPGVVRIVASE
jgi:transcriptional regulator with XRE-family HTH domain